MKNAGKSVSTNHNTLQEKYKVITDFNSAYLNLPNRQLDLSVHSPRNYNIQAFCIKYKAELLYFEYLQYVT